MAEFDDLIEQAKAKAEGIEKANKQFAEFIQSLDGAVAELKAKLPQSDPTAQQPSIWYKSKRVQGIVALGVSLLLPHLGISADEGTVTSLVGKVMEIASTGGSLIGIAWAAYGSVGAKGPVTFKGGE